MIFKRLLFIVTFLTATISIAQTNFNVCINNSWVGGGNGEIELFNGTGTAFPAGSTFEFTWPGITSITPNYGISVSGSNPFVLTFTNPIPAGGSSGMLSFGFTNSGSYFSPSSGLVNNSMNVLLVDPPCYVPPSYQNFECEKNFSELCFVDNESEGLPGEIRLGEGTVHVWNATLDVYIPTNRTKWALGLAVSHTLFTNLVGFDVMSINEYMATTIQETNCGCDGGIVAPNWVVNSYPNHELNNPVYCFDYTHGVAVGFFQEEYGTGWLELNQDIPCYIPTIDFDAAIVGKNFNSQLIGKVYHDYNNLMFLEYIKCFNVLDFLQNCADPYGAEKFVAAVYNRGFNSGFIQDVLVTNRAATMAAPDLLTHLSGLEQQYAEQISRITAVLDNHLGDVSAYGTTTYSVPWTNPHAHTGFYDEQITWSDVNDYLDDIIPMYAGVGVNMATVKTDVHSVFDAINSGGPISYRYDFHDVAKAIVLALPAFEPMSGLGQVYGNSGGNSCNMPTAKMEDSQEICNGDIAELELFLTGTAPWSVTYNFNGNDVTISNITTTPYILNVTDPGLYYLTYVEDASQIGKAICDSIIVSTDSCTIVSLGLDDLEFTADVVNNSMVDLNWSTALETNVNNYRIQRSKNALEWENLNSVNSLGYTQETNHYTSLDRNPHMDDSYYRLKIIDNNGAISFSPIRKVNITSEDVLVYPNPALNEVTIQGPGITPENIALFDAIGHEAPMILNNQATTKNSIQLDLSSFQSGMYIIVIDDSFYKVTKL